MSIKVENPNTMDRSFYVRRPTESLWKSHYYEVIEGTPETIAGVSFVRRSLTPTDLRYDAILAEFLIPCSGPARRLNEDQYVKLVHSLEPNLPLPPKYRNLFSQVKVS
jgi:hypothetical protein